MESFAFYLGRRHGDQHSHFRVAPLPTSHGCRIEQRRKTIDMLHKVATNYAVVVMIGLYTAAMAILACIGCVGQSDEL